MKLLFTADWHIRTTQPVNRIDDFLLLQKETVKFIYDTAFDNHVDYVVIAGDLFHCARDRYPQEMLIFLNDSMLQFSTVYIPGNHDLLYHADTKEYMSNIGLLNRMSDRSDIPNNIDVYHQYCSIVVPPYIEKGTTAKDLCEQSIKDVILVGDNHQSFVYRHPETMQLLVNPGCITRQKLSEKDYKPSIYIYDFDNKSAQRVYLLDKRDNVFAENRAKNLKSIESYRRIDGVEGLDFEEKILNYNKKMMVKEPVKAIIMECLS